jgi:hypothetical protein
MSNSVVLVPVSVNKTEVKHDEKTEEKNDVKIDEKPIELIVPPPLSRAESKKKQPEHLALVLSICGQALKTFGGDKPITSITILILLQHIVMAINKLTKLNVEEKKELAMVCIQWLIDNQKGLTDEEKDTLDLLAITAFPQVVDLLSEGSSSLVSCFKSCFNCSK